MKFWVLIPARAGSTRLPDKPLLKIAGKPMIGHVVETAKKSGAEKVVVATDDKRVKNVAENFGASSVITDIKHQSGYDRIAEAAGLLEAPDDLIIVNLQGDEPLMPSNIIKKVAKLKYAHPNVCVATVATPITDISHVDNTNCVKVVINHQNEAMYFSRSVIPHQREDFRKSIGSLIGKSSAEIQNTYLRHLGIYSFQVSDLKNFVSWGPCQLELHEKLEQLRWLWYKKNIKVMIETQEPAIGVDTEQDLIKIRTMLQKNKIKGDI